MNIFQYLTNITCKLRIFPKTYNNQNTKKKKKKIQNAVSLAPTVFQTDYVTMTHGPLL